MKEKRLLYRRRNINRFRGHEHNDYQNNGPQVSREDYENRRKQLEGRKNAVVQKIENMVSRVPNKREWQQYKQRFVNDFSYWNTQYDRIANGHRTVFLRELGKVVASYEKQMSAYGNGSKRESTQQSSRERSNTSSGLERVNDHTWTLHVPAGSKLSLQLGRYSWQEFGSDTVSMGSYRSNGFCVTRDRNNYNKIWIQSASTFSYAINGVKKGSSLETRKRETRSEREQREAATRLAEERAREAEKKAREEEQKRKSEEQNSLDDLFGQKAPGNDTDLNDLFGGEDDATGEVGQGDEIDLNDLFGGEDDATDEEVAQGDGVDLNELFGGGDDTDNEVAQGDGVDLNELFGSGDDATGEVVQGDDVDLNELFGSGDDELPGGNGDDELFADSDDTAEENTKKEDDLNDVMSDKSDIDKRETGKEIDAEKSDEEVEARETQQHVGSGKLHRASEEHEDVFDLNKGFVDALYGGNRSTEQLVEEAEQKITQETDAQILNQETVGETETDETKTSQTASVTENTGAIVDENMDDLGDVQRQEVAEVSQEKADMEPEEVNEAGASSIRKAETAVEGPVVADNENIVTASGPRRQVEAGASQSSDEELKQPAENTSENGEMISADIAEIQKQNTETVHSHGSLDVDIETQSTAGDTSMQRTAHVDEGSVEWLEYDKPKTISKNNSSVPEGNATASVDLEEIQQQKEALRIQQQKERMHSIVSEVSQSPNKWISSNFGRSDYRFCWIETNHNGYSGQSKLLVIHTGTRSMREYDFANHTWNNTTWEQGIPSPDGMKVVHGSLELMSAKEAKHQKKLNEAKQFPGRWRSIASGTEGYLYCYTHEGGLYAYSQQTGKLSHNTHGTTFVEIAYNRDIPRPPREYLIGKTGPVLRSGADTLGTPQHEMLSGSEYVERVKEVVKNRNQYISYEELFIDPAQPDRRFGITDAMERGIRQHGKEIFGIDAKEQALERQYNMTIETELTSVHGRSKVECSRFGLRYIESQLQQVDQQLSHYPMEIFNYLKKNNATLSIYLFDNWSSEYEGKRFDAGGFSFGKGRIGVSSVMHALDHELLHALDWADGGMDDENDHWGKSTHGEQYAQAYTGEHGAVAILKGTASGARPEGFSRRYGKTGGINEDQATIAEKMLRKPSDYRQLLGWAANDPVLAKKVQLTKAFYKKWSNGKMDNTFWKDWHYADRRGGKTVNRAYWNEKT